ncbi:hypothetical protein JCM19233_2403 [Vibrio astriarenae]|nr:hypothetical protein JCM19233_2403 [Vibrio sp. C7]
MAMTNNDNQWWKKAAIYQIYPKSFCDSGSKARATFKASSPS